MSELPPNRNPAFEAVIRRLLARRVRPAKAANRTASSSRRTIKRRARR